MTAPTPDPDSTAARAVDRVHEDALADSRSLDKDDLTRLARYISEDFEAELAGALAAVTAERDRFLALAQRADSQADNLTCMASRFKDERDQARQMLADAPHGVWCDVNVGDGPCDCWKAGL